MARYRQVHTHIWKDSWFLELEPSHKLFFIYLFTNERASISGIYELSKRVMIFESGLDDTEIDNAFEVFGQAEKAFYLDDIVWVKNLWKYHETKSPKVQTAIESDVAAIKDCQVKRIYCEEYGIDRVSDTLSIPRYSYSSSISSSSSSKNGEESKTHSGTAYETPPEATPNADQHEKRQDMVTTIAGVVKTTYAIGMTSDDFERVADALIAQGITQEDVGKFGVWWKSNGNYQGKPALKSLLNEIKNCAVVSTAAEEFGVNAIQFDE